MCLVNPFFWVYNQDCAGDSIYRYALVLGLYEKMSDVLLNSYSSFLLADAVDRVERRGFHMN